MIYYKKGDIVLSGKYMFEIGEVFPDVGKCEPLPGSLHKWEGWGNLLPVEDSFRVFAFDMNTLRTPGTIDLSDYNKTTAV
jgi:hypothetical protein